jgi:hypothetical protein
MTMTTILDPTNERVPIARQLTPRSGVITGTVAFLDITKPRGNVLLDRLEEQLKQRAPGIEIQRYAKPTFTKPAPESLRQTIKSKSNFVVEALAD